MTDAASLNGLAYTVIERRSKELRGVWPRAAALLGRQALETAIDHVEPSLREATARARLLCLPELVGEDLAHDVAHAWSALSRATHHHAYDLPPTADELLTWLEVVDRMVQRSIEDGNER